MESRHASRPDPSIAIGMAFEARAERARRRPLGAGSRSAANQSAASETSNTATGTLARRAQIHLSARTVTVLAAGESAAAS